MSNFSKKSIKHEFQIVYNEFKDESYRSVVIVSVAKIDDLLREILTKVFLPDMRKEDSLLASEGPLGTFSSRILILFRLGLIDRATFDFLNLLRKIRNDCAHKFPLKLDEGRAGDQLRALMQVGCVNPRFSYDTSFKELILENPFKAFKQMISELIIEFIFARESAKPSSLRPLVEIKESLF